MEPEQAPWRPYQGLTPELFDHYVARAHAERAKAIAGLGRQIAAWLAGIAVRLARHARLTRMRASRWPHRPVS